MFFTIPEVAVSLRSSHRSHECRADSHQGRSYEDIDELFANHTPTRQFATTKTKSQLAKEELDLVQATQATA
jgi:hypothetical protein